MKTTTISQSDPRSCEKALHVIQEGGVVAVPTDTVYGIACSVTYPQAIRQLYEVKGRDTLKAVPVLIGNMQQIDQITANFNKKAKTLANRFWPGALTIIVEKVASLPLELTAFSTVGVRMPAHEWLLELIRLSGPLAATSANLSGHADATTAGQVSAQLDGGIPLIIDGGECPGGIPSTVVDCSLSEIKILREGGIPSKSIFDLLSGE